VTSAIIIRAHLPTSLENLRRTAVPDAADGVPAHVTLMYPFAAWDELDPSIGRKIASVAARRDSFEYAMTGPGRWPDTVYVAVEPIEPFVRLQAELAVTFPEYPIYGGVSDFQFTPHITVAEGSGVDAPETMLDSGWKALPLSARAAWLDVIATDGAKWDLVWRAPLGRSPGTSAATIRP
jgi:2'-5' RNA ligase